MVKKTDEINMDWLNDGLKETESKIATGSFNLVIPSFDGKYIFRFMPVSRELDLFRPVGWHWNLGGVGNKDVPPVVCPNYTVRFIEEDGRKVKYTNQRCPVCDGITTLIATGKAKAKDFGGMDGCALKRTFFTPIYFTEFEPEAGSGKKKLPDYGQLPAHKIIQFPVSAMEELKDHMKDRKRNQVDKTVFHPDTGRLFVLKRTSDGSTTYKTNKYEEECALPEELRILDNYLDIDACIPNYSYEDIIKILHDNRHIWPELARIALSDSENIIHESDDSDNIDETLENI